MTHPDDDDSRPEWWEKEATRNWTLIDEAFPPQLRMAIAIEGVLAALIAVSKRLETIADNQLN
jgi:hypothetical protein